MRTLEPATVLIFALLPVVPCQGLLGDLIFDSIFNFLFGGQIQSGCSQLNNLLNPNNAFNCNCNGGADVFFELFPVGFEIRTECELNAPRCISHAAPVTTSYCGHSTVEAEVGLTFFGQVSLKSGRGTFDLDDGPAFQIEADIESDGSTIKEVKSCTVQLLSHSGVFSGDPSCSCDQCDTDQTMFTYDCSQANITYRGVTVPGPKSTVCVDFTFIS